METSISKCLFSMQFPNCFTFSSLTYTLQWKVQPPVCLGTSPRTQKIFLGLTIKQRTKPCAPAWKPCWGGHLHQTHELIPWGQRAERQLETVHISTFQTKWAFSKEIYPLPLPLSPKYFTRNKWCFSFWEPQYSKLCTDSKNISKLPAFLFFAH